MYCVIRSVRDQLAGATGSVALPWFYANTLIAMLAVTPVLCWLTARLPRRVARLELRVLHRLSRRVCTVVRRAGTNRHAHLRRWLLHWVSVFNLFVVSLFWNLMADLFDGEQAKRVFPLIALGGAFGALVGLSMTSLFVLRIGVAPRPAAVNVAVLVAVAVFAGRLRWCAVADAAGAGGGGPLFQ